METAPKTTFHIALNPKTMAFESITDDKIADLLNCPKILVNPQTRARLKDGHKQLNYKAVATNSSKYQFEIYLRQNLREGMEDDFSCGISWIAPNGETLTLKRYNGASHNHYNQLEKNRLGYTCHIHIATEKYIKANRKAEGFAQATNRFMSASGAFHCLIVDCKITGIPTNPDIMGQPNLFNL
jgi:hypothetical protein